MYDDYDDPLAELRDIDDAETLQRLLVTHRHLYGSGHQDEAVELFRRAHAGRPAGGVDTAVLLSTNWRWHRCTARLLPALVGTGILGEDQLDELAERLFWPDSPTITHPLAWLGLDWGEVEQDRTVVDEQSPPPPPVRRWSATRLLRRKRTTLAAVLRRARSLRDKFAAESIVAGVLDAHDSLDDKDRRRALDSGLASGRGTVRRQALELLAARDGWPAAIDRASGDADASVRKWATAMKATTGGTLPG